MKNNSQLQLQAYLDGELPDPDRKAVEALLANDPSAAALLSELSRTQQALKENEPVTLLPFQDQSTGLTVVWIDYGENDPVETPEIPGSEDPLQAI